MALGLQLFIGSLALMVWPVLVLAQNSCSTPEGAVGNCVPALDCEYVRHLREKYGVFIPVSVQRQLKAASCTAGQRSLHICCPIKSAHAEPHGSDYKSNPFLANKPGNNNNGNGVGNGNTNVRVGSSMNSKRIDQRGLQVLNSVSECGKKSNIKVSNGEETRIGEFPWLALLKYDTDSPRKFLCGGSLISDRYVLTAAHCVVQSGKLIGVRLGEHNLSTYEDCQWRGRTRECLPPYEEYGIEEIKSHPGYNHGAIPNDIALVKLDRPVQLKAHIKPVCLPIDNNSQNVAFDQSYYIAGWGRTEQSSASQGDASQVLLKALVKRKELDICRRYYNNAPVSENHVCAVGVGNVHTCSGDSGGPLFFPNRFKETVRYIQYGVVSYGGSRCGRFKEQPGVYANVIDLLPWITQNID